MPSYKIKGKGRDTGRKRTRIYSAVNEEVARKLAEVDGTIVEDIYELPPKQPTDNQLDYAKHLEVTIPPEATANDVSALISMKLDKDKPATERHRQFAIKYGIEVSPYIGKKGLFDRIQAELIIPGRENELASWFTYRVYRKLVKGANEVSIESPDDPVIQEIAVQLESDETIIKSIRRYSGSDLIWFGEWTAPDGYVHTGGSNQSKSYKKAFALLSGVVRISALKAGNAGVKKTLKQRKGCLLVIAVVLMIPLGSIAVIAWFRELIA